ncbi:penicillin-binding protein 2 [Candidatus Microgenomates bacterium]|nr:penicillin-binding protein 2 [Candidatus Microgenomates bacterium]
MKRISVVFIFIFLFFLIIIARLFYWQFLVSDQLKVQAEDQYLLKEEMPARRGEILYADGQPLVANEKCFLVFAQPKETENDEKSAKELSSILEMDEATIAARLSQKNLFWTPIKHKVEDDKVEAIKALNLSGIGFQEESKRFYPEGSASAHLSGFVGKDAAGKDKGYFGLEGYYDRELKGRPGFLTIEKDPQGNPILTSSREEFDKENGSSLVLNIDRTVQYILENKLKEGIKKYDAKTGGVILMNPKTGEVSGMVSYPSYDQENFLDFNEERFKNPLISDFFEPGSIFKVIIMASALDKKLVEPDTLYDEKGPVSIGGYKIKTWNDEYNGEITMTEVLERSSNVGMVWVAEKLGLDNTFSYLKKFGFGQKTDIDFQEEFLPEIRPKEQWREIDLATASFGQGIAVTPIQILRAVGAIANKGRLVKPYVVQKIINENGKVKKIKPQVGKKVITSETAAVLTEMMVASVEHGEAKWNVPEGFRIAGKTGTAQIPVAGHYDPDKTVASFIGFAPADDPKFVMLIILREPSASPWASETAAPLFFDIAKELFNYYGLSPD